MTNKKTTKKLGSYGMVSGAISGGNAGLPPKTYPKPSSMLGGTKKKGKK